jgi:uncharacterized coiled-coil DUF342 family protein
MNDLALTQTSNTKLFEEFNDNLNAQLEKMVEDFQQANKKYGEILKQISTLHKLNEHHTTQLTGI